MKGKNAMLSFVDMLINEQGFIDTMLETKDRAALKRAVQRISRVSHIHFVQC